MQLGSYAAAAVAVGKAGGYSSDLTPSLGSSTCHGFSPKMTKDRGKKKKKKKKRASLIKQHLMAKRSPSTNLGMSIPSTVG